MTDLDDAWFNEWKRQIETSDGSIILALGMRPRALSQELVVIEMPMSPNVRQGTGVFAAGGLIQLADVGATMLYWQLVEGQEDAPFPLSVQISTNILRNTDHGMAVSETRAVHFGRTMLVAESRVSDDEGHLLAIVTSTHLAVRAGRRD